MTLWLIVAAVLVVAAAILLLTRRRGGSDGVANFQRQINALSQEARRPVIDQVQRAAEDDINDGHGQRDNDGKIDGKIDGDGTDKDTK